MNEVKLSGVLGQVGEYTAPSGGSFRTVKLEFTHAHDTILLLAVSDRIEQLDGFDAGAHVTVTGRLACFSGGFVIMIDEIRDSRRRHRDARDFGSGQTDLREVYLSDGGKGKRQSWR
jgi:hypothetical protein